MCFRVVAETVSSVLRTAAKSVGARFATKSSCFASLHAALHVVVADVRVVF